MQTVNLQGIGMTSQRTRERLIRRLEDQGIYDSRVLDVMRTTPRHIFVDEAMAHRAYEDTSLPIGFSQTLSQPYIVAKMTELLLASSDDTPKRVLEVGTGSGYQTAVLAQLVEKVYSVERIQPLQDKARERMRLLRLHNVSMRLADGNWGWPDVAPFDAILSAAAPAKVPEELIQQLAVGGCLIIPVGDREQKLHVITRTESGHDTRIIEAVNFVPLLSGVVRNSFR